MATAPNQTWTWDITLLRGPRRGVYYVVLGLFSPYTVGWLLARTENGKLAARLLRDDDWNVGTRAGVAYALRSAGLGTGHADRRDQ